MLLSRDPLHPAQGPIRPVLVSRHPLPSACICPGTCRTCGVFLGPTAFCCSRTRRTWVLSRDPLPLPAHAQGPVGQVVSPFDTLPPACRCSGTCKYCGVFSGPTAPCLPLLMDAQYLKCHIETHCPMPAPAQGPTVLCMLQLRDPQDMWWRLGNHCPLPTAAQGPARTLLSSLDPLPPPAAA